MRPTRLTGREIVMGARDVAGRDALLIVEYAFDCKSERPATCLYVVVNALRMSCGRTSLPSTSCQRCVKVLDLCCCDRRPVSAPAPN